METPYRYIHPHDAADSAPLVSPIWQATIDKYYEELRRGGVKAPAVDQDLWSIHSPDDLLQQIQPLIPEGSTPPANWVWSLRRLKPILVNINDFVAIMTLALGMNGQAATVIWGSIRLILKFAQPVLPEVLDMFEELSRALPRFPEQELPMTKSLEDALLGAYTEIIVFCAHSIGFFWNNPNITKSGSSWLKFSNDFSKVIAELRTSSRIVDERAHMIRLIRDTSRIDTIDAIRDSQGHHSSEKNLPCYMIPYGLNLRFYGRTPETERLEKALDPRSPSGTMRVIAIHGTGGVGKTQLALNYANTSMNLYDAVIWIPSETQMKVMQTLSTFSRRLGISGSEDVEDDYQSIQRVRNWLNTSGKAFLLVFDNVENDANLDQIWPTSARGSVIITCRSQSVASKRTADSIHLQCFTPETGLQVLVSLTGLQSATTDEEAAARELIRILGGHPLAMVHISEFIRDRGYSYQELLPVYKKSAQKILARSEVPSQYGYTIGTVWDVSFETLSVESRVLLGILAFFNPDNIPEWILSNTRAGITESGMQFLFDEFEFGDAIIGLTKTSLIHRLSSHKAISINRLIQFTVFSRLSAMSKTKYLDFAVRVLSHGFPNSWNDRTLQQGHGWASWETCGTILPHISWLIRLTREHSLQVTDVELFAELIFRAGTYLWEKEQPTMARSFIEYGLSLNIKQSTPNYAQAYRLLGHIGLDLAQPRAALAAYEKALAAREALEEPNSPPIADVYDSIACSYTEQGRVAEAFEYLSKAANIHRAHNPLHMGRTQAIYAMTYLRAEQPGEALTALKSCWELQGLDEEQISQSKYPKHSGDILLLSRIKYAQGLKKEAQQLASRTISIRRGLFGDKGPRVADSMFTVARMLEADGGELLAAKLLRSVVEMSRGVSAMQGHLARSLWFLAAIESRLGDSNQAEILRVEARRERQGIVGRETADEDSDDSFMQLVGWMLW